MRYIDSAILVACFAAIALSFTKGCADQHTISNRFDGASKGCATRCDPIDFIVIDDECLCRVDNGWMKPVSK